MGVQTGDCDGDRSGLVGLVLVSSSGNSIVQGIAQKSEVQLGDRDLDPTGVLWDLYLLIYCLGSTFGRLCSIRNWSRWPGLQGSIR